MQLNDGRVVSNFIVQALTNEPISIYGDGEQTRSFCYVDDLADGIIRLMASDDSIIGPTNLGNPVETTIAELAQVILRLTGSKSEIVRLPLPIDDPMRRCPDISKASRELDWRPKVSLEQGLIKTIEYFDKVLSTESH